MEAVELETAIRMAKKEESELLWNFLIFFRSFIISFTKQIFVLSKKKKKIKLKKNPSFLL